jgi:hypothetical protein
MFNDINIFLRCGISRPRRQEIALNFVLKSGAKCFQADDGNLVDFSLQGSSNLQATTAPGNGLQQPAQ